MEEHPKFQLLGCGADHSGARVAYTLKYLEIGECREKNGARIGGSRDEPHKAMFGCQLRAGAGGSTGADESGCMTSG